MARTSELEAVPVGVAEAVVLAPGRPQKSLTEHGRIVAAIVAGDRGAAERAMHEHLNNVAAALADA